MLNQAKVKRLSKEQRKTLDKLTKEYNEATEAARTRSLRGPKREVIDRHHKATKCLAEFYAQHNLLSR